MSEMESTPVHAVAPGLGRVAAARSGLIYVFGAAEGLAFGYDAGVIASALLFIRKQMGLTPALQGAVVSSLLFGALLGAPCAGYLGNRLGARRLLAISGALFFVGSLGAALAPSPLLLIVSRYVIGIGVGIGTVQAPAYLAELAPAALRGRMTSLYQLMVAIGIFLAYVSGFFLSPHGNWRAMFAIGVVPALVLMLGVVLLPDSPRWLALKGRPDEARRVLAVIRGHAEVEAEFQAIRVVAERPHIPLRVLLRTPWLKRVLFLTLAIAIFQQALGINTIVYYTPTILHAAGFTAGNAILTGIGLQALSIAMTFITTRIVDSTGRRILLMGGALAMAGSMAMLGIIFHLSLLASVLGAAAAIGCLALFKAAFSASWGALVWAVVPELLPTQARAAGMGAWVFTTYSTNVLISFVFPVLLASGPTIAFETFAAVGVVAFVVVMLFLPETTKRSLEQIERGGETERA